MLRARRWSSVDPAPGAGRAVALELGQEALDHAALASLVVQALADDPAGEAGREGADLGTQRGDRLLALGLDLRLAVLDDPRGLGLGLLPHLGDDRRTLLACLLTDARGLVPGVGELLLELGELRVGLGLLGLGRAQATLDRLRALPEGPLEARHDELAQKHVEDREDDEGED